MSRSFTWPLVLAACVGCSEDNGVALLGAQQAASSPANDPPAAGAPAHNSVTVPADLTGLRASQLAGVLLAQFPEYDECPRPDDPGTLRYVAGSADLNGDRKSELIALTLGREACGSGGCTAFVLRDTGNNYQVVTRITTVSAPILAAANRSYGWSDLIVGVAGGGAAAEVRVLRYSGKSYPDNASLAPRATQEASATRIIFDESAAVALVPEGCTETFAATDAEALGGLRRGATSSTVERLLGYPKDIGKPELWGGDGLFHRTWTYPATGVVVGLSATKAKGPWEIFSVTLKAPAKLESAGGIGIGASRKEVLAAYGKAAHPVGAPVQGRNTLIVGSEYDGLIFSFDAQDRVARIFLGPAAE